MSQYERILHGLLFITGIINVLVLKGMDLQRAKGLDKVERTFYHPFVQVGLMFFGEFLCFIVYKITFLCLERRRDGSEETNILTAGGRDFSPKLFIFPALCDLVASAMLFIGLYLTYASSYQILRGTILIFVGIFNANYLNQALKKTQWFGIFVITLGLICIPLADIQNQNLNTNGILTGDLLILCAEVIHAVQLVYEEKYVRTLNIPSLQSVGWEGIIGAIMLSVLLIPLYFLKSFEPFDNNTYGVVENLPDALVQLFNSYTLICAAIIFIISVAFYNFAAISLTKSVSSTNRIAIDSVRIIAIWILSFPLGLQKFVFLQLFGMIVLFIGIFIYQNIVFVQIYRSILSLFRRRSDTGEEEVISQPADAI